MTAMPSQAIRILDSLEDLCSDQATQVSSKRAAPRTHLAAALSHELNNAACVLEANWDLLDRYLSNLLKQPEEGESIRSFSQNA